MASSAIDPYFAANELSANAGLFCARSHRRVAASNQKRRSTGCARRTASASHGSQPSPLNPGVSLGRHQGVATAKFFTPNALNTGACTSLVMRFTSSGT
jgi:hypothetical protein